MLEFKDLMENFEYPDAKVIEYKGKDIFIKQYLPASNKFELIKGCLIVLNLGQLSYVPLIGELLFDVELVRAYSNIIFEEEHNTNFFKTYDVLHELGIINLIIENIPAAEYEELLRLYEQSINYEIDRYHNFAMMTNQILTQLPDIVDKIGDEIDTFDPTKFEQAMEILGKIGETTVTQK